MQRMNINYTYIESFQIPKCLVDHLMCINIENSDQTFEMNFRTCDSLKSEFKKVNEKGPIFNITKLTRNL